MARVPFKIKRWHGVPNLKSVDNTNILWQEEFQEKPLLVLDEVCEKFKQYSISAYALNNFILTLKAR